MEDGRIHNLDLQTSSNFIIAHSPHVLGPNFGRLNSKYAWCSQEQKYKVVGEYFEVAFDKYTRISSIATQVPHPKYIIIWPLPLFDPSNDFIVISFLQYFFAFRLRLFSFLIDFESRILQAPQAI